MTRKCKVKQKSRKQNMYLRKKMLRRCIFTIFVMVRLQTDILIGFNGYK